MTRFLDQEVFGLVVASTPLISIDLILRSSDQKVLLGERVNRPAKGFWFVPGGRVYKNETLDKAFTRIAQDELGLGRYRKDADLLGVFEHLYQDSQFGEKKDDPSTHYVVIGYAIDIQLADLDALPKQQHHAYRWWSREELMASPDVHQNTKNYFLTI